MVGKKAVRQHRYRAAKRGGQVTPYNFERICDVFKNASGNVTCGTCGRVVWKYKGKSAKDRKATVGHVVPISRGGGDTFYNVFPQCLKCNRIQGSRVLFREITPERPHDLLQIFAILAK